MDQCGTALTEYHDQWLKLLGIDGTLHHGRGGSPGHILRRLQDHPRALTDEQRLDDTLHILALARHYALSGPITTEQACFLLSLTADCGRRPLDLMDHDIIQHIYVYLSHTESAGETFRSFAAACQECALAAPEGVAHRYLDEYLRKIRSETADSNSPASEHYTPRAFAAPPGTLPYLRGNTSQQQREDRHIGTQRLVRLAEWFGQLGPLTSFQASILVQFCGDCGLHQVDTIDEMVIHHVFMTITMSQEARDILLQFRSWCLSCSLAPNTPSEIADLKVWLNDTPSARAAWGLDDSYANEYEWRNCAPLDPGLMHGFIFSGSPPTQENPRRIIDTPPALHLGSYLLPSRLQDAKPPEHFAPRIQEAERRLTHELSVAGRIGTPGAKLLDLCNSSKLPVAEASHFLQPAGMSHAGWLSGSLAPAGLKTHPAQGNALVTYQEVVSFLTAQGSSLSPGQMQEYWEALRTPKRPRDPSEHGALQDPIAPAYLSSGASGAPAVSDPTSALPRAGGGRSSFLLDDSDDDGTDEGRPCHGTSHPSSQPDQGHPTCTESPACSVEVTVLPGIDDVGMTTPPAPFTFHTDATSFGAFHQALGRRIGLSTFSIQTAAGYVTCRQAFFIAIRTRAPMFITPGVPGGAPFPTIDSAQPAAAQPSIQPSAHSSVGKLESNIKAKIEKVLLTKGVPKNLLGERIGAALAKIDSKNLTTAVVKAKDDEIWEAMIGVASDQAGLPLFQWVLDSEKQNKRPRRDDVDPLQMDDPWKIKVHPRAARRNAAAKAASAAAANEGSFTLTLRPGCFGDHEGSPLPSIPKISMKDEGVGIVHCPNLAAELVRQAKTKPAQGSLVMLCPLPVDDPDGHQVGTAYQHTLHKNYRGQNRAGPERFLQYSTRHNARAVHDEVRR